MHYWCNSCSAVVWILNSHLWYQYKKLHPFFCIRNKEAIGRIDCIIFFAVVEVDEND